MNLQFYYFLHFVGMIMVFLAYGGLIVRSVCGSDNAAIRRLGAMTSGIGLLFILVGGFGLQAKLGYGWPLWVILKIAIWVVLGGLIVLINRKPALSQVLWYSTILLGIAAVALGLFKPF
jgi:hypothetical protein